MNSICTSILLSTALLATGASAGFQPHRAPLGSQERADLRDRGSETLLLQRAGRTTPIRSLDGTERNELRRLEQRNSQLETQRAGELSNNTLLTILVIIGIVALVLIIA